MSRGCLVAVGSINVDFQVRARRWPLPGESLLVSEFQMHGGGKGANAAYIGHRLGVDSLVVARVGADILSEVALRPLREAGVDVSHVKVVEGQSTGVALIVVQPNGEKVIFLADNANEAWSADDAAAVAEDISCAGKPSALVIDLEVPLSVVRAALAATRDRGQTVILDPSPAERITDDLYALTDYLTPNASEAMELTGLEVRSLEDAYRAGRILVDRGVKVALLKLGERGCAMVDRHGARHILGYKVQVVDTTGAGDAFAGSLAVALLEGRSPTEAVEFAVAASALSVTKFGSQPSYPTRDEVEAMLATHGRR